MNALVTVPQNNAEIYRASTDAAALCRDIVVATAMEIQDRKYVRVEGWQAIAIAHGCTASAGHVERINGGVRAIGEIRRMSDGALIAQAEGFVGEDEPTWYGGTVEKDEWTGPRGNRRKTGQKISTVLPKRSDYAIRAMAQTRAISRACRSAFAHVVVMMNAGLSTTPAEEVPDGGFIDADYSEAPVSRAETKSVGKQDAAPKARPTAAIDGAKVCIDMCGDASVLDTWLEEKSEQLDRLKADHPEAYKEIMDHADERRGSFSGSGDFGDLSSAATALGKAA